MIDVLLILKPYFRQPQDRIQAFILLLALNVLFTSIVALNFDSFKCLSICCLLETVLAYQTGKRGVKALLQLFREL